MSDVETLAEELRSELKNYLSALRQEEAIKKWLENEQFRVMFEEHEQRVRQTLSGFIESETQKIPAEEPYRQAIFHVAAASLRVCLEACKDIMKTTAEAMVNGFGNLS